LAWICGIQLGAWLFLSPGVEPNSARLRPRGECHRQLLAEIAARRIADDMRALDAEMVEQLDDIGDQPVERKRLFRWRHLRAAVAAQIEPAPPASRAARYGTQAK